MQLQRIQIRHIGAVAAVLMAGIYYLIGLGVLNVGTSTSGETVDLAMFGISAGSAFLIVGLLLAFTDRRWLFGLALIFQFFVYVVYIGAAGGREPSYEIWGITLRIIQLVVIGALAYLTVTAREPAGMEAEK